MTANPELRTLIGDPFELLREMERRSRAGVVGREAADSSGEWVGVGFSLGDDQFIADREQVREVLMLPDTITRVPGAKNWLLGIANLRGHLLPLIDLKLFLGGGRTKLQRAARVIAINHREVPSGLVVDDVQGFRRFMGAEFQSDWPQPSLRCEHFLAGAYKRSEHCWPVFDFYALLESGSYLQAMAE